MDGNVAISFFLFLIIVVVVFVFVIDNDLRKGDDDST